MQNVMTLEAVRELAPAAFSGNKANHLTDNYEVITTSSAIPILADHGFFPVGASSRKGRTEERKGLNAHIIKFARETDINSDHDHGQIILMNSNDGSASLRLYAGFWRFACANGLVCGEGFSNRYRHTKAVGKSFEGLVNQAAEQLPALESHIGSMRGKLMSKANMLDFAYNAAKLRWEAFPEDDQPEGQKIENGAYFNKDMLPAMIKPRRNGDGANNMWLTFNRMQETLLRGGVDIYSVSDKTQGQPVLRRARPVTGAVQSVQINRNLWDLADTYV